MDSSDKPAVNDSKTIGHKNAEVVDDQHFPLALKKIQTRALRLTADAQICRLLQLANLLDVPSAVDRSADVLRQHADDIRDATTVLEETMHALSDLQGRGSIADSI